MNSNNSCVRTSAHCINRVDGIDELQQRAVRGSFVDTDGHAAADYRLHETRLKPGVNIHTSQCRGAAKRYAVGKVLARSGVCESAGAWVDRSSDPGGALIPNNVSMGRAGRHA